MGSGLISLIIFSSVALVGVILTVIFIITVSVTFLLSGFPLPIRNIFYVLYFYETKNKQSKSKWE